VRVFCAAVLYVPKRCVGVGVHIASCQLLPVTGCSAEGAELELELDRGGYLKVSNSVQFLTVQSLQCIRSVVHSGFLGEGFRRILRRDWGAPKKRANVCERKKSKCVISCEKMCNRVQKGEESQGHRNVRC
jgi:hypothetical protein